MACRSSGLLQWSGVGPQWGHNWRGNEGKRGESKRRELQVRSPFALILPGCEGAAIGLENPKSREGLPGSNPQSSRHLPAVSHHQEAVVGPHWGRNWRRRWLSRHSTRHWYACSRAPSVRRWAGDAGSSGGPAGPLPHAQSQMPGLNAFDGSFFGPDLHQRSTRPASGVMWFTQPWLLEVLRRNRARLPMEVRLAFILRPGSRQPRSC